MPKYFNIIFSRVINLMRLSFQLSVTKDIIKILENLYLFIKTNYKRYDYYILIIKIKNIVRSIKTVIWPTFN